MMVYSIDNRESFIHINKWLKEVKLQCDSDIKIILIGNKSDLEGQRKVSYEEAKKFKDENQMLYFEETSAKTGINTKEVFIESAKLLYEEYKRYQNRAESDKSVGDKYYFPPLPKLIKYDNHKPNIICFK